MRLIHLPNALTTPRACIGLSYPLALISYRLLRESIGTRKIPKVQSRSIRSILPRVRWTRYNTELDVPSGSLSTPARAAERKTATIPLRTGVIAQKCGMTGVYDTLTGARRPATVLQLDSVQVVATKSDPARKYWAVQIGAVWKHPKKVNKPELGHFSKAKVPPKRFLAEFRVQDERGLLPVGTALGANWFQEGSFVDLQGVGHGKGFAGGMKRHGWSGQPASHGQSGTHRTMGSAGGSQGSGSRVIPGKKMPGRMGGNSVTVHNLRVLKVDHENGILLVHGCVPGPKGSTVKIRDAILKPWPETHQAPTPNKESHDQAPTG